MTRAALLVVAAAACGGPAPHPLAYAAPSVTAVAGIEGLAVADFDGDGRPDVATTGSAGVALLRNAPDGALVPVWSEPTVEGPLAVADVDRDGRPDLVVADAAALAFLISRGDGSFDVAHARYDSTVSATHVAVADVDGDGRRDVVLGGDGLAVELGAGEGTRAFAAWVVPGVAGVTSLATDDLDGDGRDEVLIAAQTLGNAAVVRGTNVVPLVGEGFVPQAVAVAILDGRKTVAVSHLDGIDLFPVVADTPRFAATVPLSTADLLVGDLDGDGRDDLVGDAGVVRALRGGFAVEIYGEGLGHAVPAALADLDGDGLPDLVALVPGVGFFVAHDDGGRLMPSVPTCADGNRFATGDLDGDGRADVATVFDDTLLACFGAADRRLRPLPLATGWLRLVALADVDGDGRMDVVGDGNDLVTALAPAPGGARVVVSATGAGPVLDGFLVHGLLVHDPGGDGRRDLLAANGGAASLFPGDRRGGFRPASQSIPVQNVDGLADLDGDGRDELIADTGGALQSAALLDDGSFDAPQTFESVDGPLVVAVADLDGDGAADVVYAAGTDVSWRRGGTAGTAKLAWHATARVVAVAVGDLDGDGTPDLVVSLGDVLAIERGNGDGSFADGPRLFAPAVAQVAIADVDGDGLADLVTDGPVIFAHAR